MLNGERGPHNPLIALASREGSLASRRARPGKTRKRCGQRPDRRDSVAPLDLFHMILDISSGMDYLHVVKQENHFVAELWRYLAPFIDTSSQSYLSLDGIAARKGVSDHVLADADVP